MNTETVEIPTVDYKTAIKNGVCAYCGEPAVGLPDSHFLAHQQKEVPNEATPSVPAEKDVPVSEVGEPRKIDQIKPLTKKQFSHDELLEALYWIHMIFEKATMTMLLVKSTGKQAFADKPLEGDGIYIATRQLEWDSGNRYVIDTLAQYEDTSDTLVTYRCNNGVPVYLQIVTDDYCVTSPDGRPYKNEWFQYPNPPKRFEEVYG